MVTLIGHDDKSEPIKKYEKQNIHEKVVNC